MGKFQIQNKNSDRGNAKKCKVQCVYVDGKPLIHILILRLNELLARVVIVAGCDVYTFAFKEEAKEFLREFLKEKLGAKEFEIGPCQL